MSTTGERAVRASPEPSVQTPSASRRLDRQGLTRLLRLPLLIAAPVLALAIALYLYLSSGRYESTDDAYIGAARVDVSANIAGRVTDLEVHDNQPVRKGDVLFKLDAAPVNDAAAQAEATLAAARQAADAAGAAYRQRTVEVAAAQTTLAYQERELARQRILAASGVNSQAQLDAQVQAVASAKAQVAAARQAQIGALATLGGRPDAPVSENPAVREAAAALDRARLNQTYTVIRAAQDGTVTKVNQLQVGDYVNAAQPVFSLVAPKVWIEANFKEDQLTYMRPGQPADLKIDAYPQTTLHGRVQSLSPGTGSSFSLLPAENATGNWVKVVQRLPVRISIDSPPADLPLHAGLSVTVKVDTGHRRRLFGGGGQGDKGAR